MLLGKIVGKVTTQEFSFNITGKVKKFDFVQTMHPLHDFVLSQVVDIRSDEQKSIALCQVLGYKKNDRLHKLRVPLDPGSEVLKAKNKFIKEIIQVDDDQGSAFIGTLEGKMIQVRVNLDHVLTKHIAVLAKTGSGKSYAVGVLIEEILDKKVPILIIDPHGEYNTLTQKTTNESDIRRLGELQLKPTSFKIKEYGDSNAGYTPLKISNQLSQGEIIELFPGKLSSAQMGILYGAMQDTETLDFNSLLFKLEAEEAAGKWNLIHTLQYLKGLDIFSEHYTPYSELIQSGRASILNLKGYNPDVQDMLVSLLCKNLFQLRKEGKISPFFLVIEEAHNFCPERSFGEKKSSKILRTIASEGRKFGLGLCVVSQRPARVDKSVLSQCGTQIILKVTNPNDLKAISNSVEGLTGATEKEIQNLSIGTALVTGVTDLPLFVSIRPRLTMHGGHSVNLLESVGENFHEKKSEFEQQELLPIITPTITENDFKIMNDRTEITKQLVPAQQFRCKDNTGEFNLIVDLVEGKLLTNIDLYEGKKLPDFTKLEKADILILQKAFSLKSFTIEDLSKKIGRLIDKNELQGLINNNLIIKKSNNYILNEEYLFSSLKTAANYSKIEYQKVVADLKIKVISPDIIREKLSKLVPILDSSECYILKYE